LRCVQHRVNRAGRQTPLSAQRAPRPASLRFRLLAGQGLHFLPHRGIVFRRPPRARRIAQPFQSERRKRPPPFSPPDPRRSAVSHGPLPPPKQSGSSAPAPAPWTALAPNGSRLFWFSDRG